MWPPEQSPPPGEAVRDVLNALVQSEDVGACLIDLNSRKVVFQNKSCQAVCGLQKGAACTRELFGFCGGREEFSFIKAEMRLSHCEQTEKGESFDVVSIRNKNHTLVLLYPLEKQLQIEEAFFCGMGLTERQLEIIRLIARKKNNSEICGELGITQNTLRTHLKNIYRKIPDHGKKHLLQLRK